ncbi:MAG: ArnT family glycosyltransferase [Bacteroidota bacterium]
MTDLNHRPFTSTEKITVATFIGANFLLHLLVNLSGAYGFFRDEFYYIACSEHLAWGYVDQPPFCIYVLKLSRLLLGDSLVAIRFVPAVVTSGTLLLTALMAKELGGKTFAIFLACLAVFVSPVHIGSGSIFSMGSIDIFFWALAAYIMVRLINTQNNKLWIWLGVVLGLGLLNKISMLFMGAGIAVGIFMTNRKWLATHWPYLAGTLALVLFLPYILWNINHDMAHLEFIHNASSGKYSGRSRLDFVVEQMLIHHPLNSLIWITGLLALFFYSPLKPYRILGWIYFTAFVVLLANGTSKGEYLSPAYMMLFAASGVFIEQKLTSRSVIWLRYVYPVLLVTGMVLLLPLIMPVLPVEKYIAYTKSAGLKPTSSENKELSELPQFYADMFGWEEKVKDVAEVYRSLSPEDQQRCAIYSTNYGRCGSIDFLGKAYGLPSTIGGHNNYWIWGPRHYTGEVVIIVGGDLEDHVGDFEKVELAKVSTCKYCMPYENNVGIFIGRRLKYDISDAWKEAKHYD